MLSKLDREYNKLFYKDEYDRLIEPFRVSELKNYEVKEPIDPKSIDKLFELRDKAQPDDEYQKILTATPVTKSGPSYNITVTKPEFDIRSKSAAELSSIKNNITARTNVTQTVDRTINSKDYSLGNDLDSQLTSHKQKFTNPDQMMPTPGSAWFRVKENLLQYIIDEKLDNHHYHTAEHYSAEHENATKKLDSDVNKYVANYIKVLTNKIIDFIMSSPAYKVLKDVMGVLWDIVDNVLGTILEIIKSLGDMAINVIELLLQTMVRSIGLVLNAFLGLNENIFEQISEDIADFFDQPIKVLTSIFWSSFNATVALFFKLIKLFYPSDNNNDPTMLQSFGYLAIIIPVIVWTLVLSYPLILLVGTYVVDILTKISLYTQDLILMN